MVRCPAWICAAMTSLMLSVSSAQADEVAPVATHGAWARATVATAMSSAAYLTIENRGKTDQRLIGVAAPVADSVALHESRMVDGLMTMRPVRSVTIPSGGSLVLRPGGVHVMLTGLKGPLAAGESFPLTLTFEGAGPVDVMVAVRSVGTQQSKAGHGPGMHHHHQTVPHEAIPMSGGHGMHR